MKDNSYHLRSICRAAFVAIVSAIGLAAIAHAQPAPESQRYRIGAGDVLDIRILNRPQLSLQLLALSLADHNAHSIIDL